MRAFVYHLLDTSFIGIVRCVCTGVGVRIARRGDSSHIHFDCGCTYGGVLTCVPVLPQGNSLMSVEGVGFEVSDLPTGK
jgi:hypothetical protein